jgi:hypothetical protein
MLWRNIAPPPPGQKSTPRKKPERSQQQAEQKCCFTLTALHSVISQKTGLFFGSCFSKTMQGEEVSPMVCSVNKESLLVILTEEVALVEHCRVPDGLTNNTADCIIINIAMETSTMN